MRNSKETRIEQGGDNENRRSVALRWCCSMLTMQVLGDLFVVATSTQHRRQRRMKAQVWRCFAPSGNAMCVQCSGCVVARGAAICALRCGRTVKAQRERMLQRQRRRRTVVEVAFGSSVRPQRVREADAANVTSPKAPWSHPPVLRG